MHFIIAILFFDFIIATVLLKYSLKKNGHNKLGWPRRITIIDCKKFGDFDEIYYSKSDLVKATNLEAGSIPPKPIFRYVWLEMPHKVLVLFEMIMNLPLTICDLELASLCVQSFSLNVIGFSRHLFWICEPAVSWLLPNPFVFMFWWGFSVEWMEDGWCGFTRRVTNYTGNTVLESKTFLLLLFQSKL